MQAIPSGGGQLKILHRWILTWIQVPLVAPDPPSGYGLHQPSKMVSKVNADVNLELGSNLPHKE